MFRTVRCTLQGNKFLRIINHWQGVCRFSSSGRRVSEESSQHAVPSFEKSDSVGSPEENPPIPPPPPLELCCMSGCQNCVMIQHAEELMKMYDDDSAARAALEEIPDENLKTFLKMEMNFKEQ